ncbi:GNAT family N-acetyltransferase [Streptomyces hoynatensis]|uniref:GNAT family N-acetyltransferase n=2 Tax=Streptomyces hoynatensis TaxID=1141874 RepID=A0A3A9ZC20_9ACTN|nr:GNAT family N-acetyltransferase [Streptomyces hoynatensis]
MLEAMGTPVGPEDAPWRAAALDWFTRRLGDTEEFAAFVVAEPALGLVSAAVGSLDHHAPGPANPSGLYGYISNVSTDPRCRRRGYARACLKALLGWFEAETPAPVLNLNATAHGRSLYTGLGFAPPHFPALQAHLPLSPPPVAG